ncbi:hypothetical protein CSOJ01_00832 [Colletotrichum sojae]|uniref:Uncharacterized protein n=1 Tax=Colletotrichum sojae TaxID=2175907 RepID=A0A8H6N5U3_9PEZI|nr:hypothetical protein CSOJ01_00832 [Colletotrichum sojae]
MRAFYNEEDRDTFDLGYHDESKAAYARRGGREPKNAPFSLARYHPGTKGRKESETSWSSGLAASEHSCQDKTYYTNNSNSDNDSDINAHISSVKQDTESK